MRGVHRQDEDEEGLVPPAVVVKGKRSKRQRVHAPPVVLTAEWSSSATASATAPGEEGDSASGTSADDAASTGGCCVTEEEEDMARCLMLLSRGEPAAAKGVGNKEGGEAAVVKDARFRSRQPAAGEFVYECKTCSRCFPSFQALGGHRTSHKQKPRLLPPSDDKSNPATADAPSTAPPPPAPSSALKEASSDATALAVVPNQEPGTVSPSPTTSSRHPSRVHECSVCGAGFASGQALGGHMRRHRPLAPPRKEKSLLELDLNMPCDEFGFAKPAAAAMLFPAALVDCHY